MEKPDAVRQGKARHRLLYLLGENRYTAEMIYCKWL